MKLKGLLACKPFGFHNNGDKFLWKSKLCDAGNIHNLTLDELKKCRDRVEAREKEILYRITEILYDVED